MAGFNEFGMLKLVHFAAFTFHTTIDTIVGPRLELHLVQPEKLAFVER